MSRGIRVVRGPEPAMRPFDSLNALSFPWSDTQPKAP